MICSLPQLKMDKFSFMSHLPSERDGFTPFMLKAVFLTCIINQLISTL